MSNRLSFLMSDTYGRGKISIFSVSPIVEWSNFPLKGSFIPLIHSNIIASNYSDLYNYTLPIEWKVDANSLIGLDNFQVIYNNHKVKTYPKVLDGDAVYINDILLPGYYSLPYSNNANQIAVNIDSREIVSSFMNKDDLDSLFNREVVFIKEKDGIAEKINNSRRGVELWRYLLYLLILLITVEMIISNGWQKKNIR